MNTNLVNWALKERVGCSGGKAILLTLASLSDDSGLCVASQETIAQSSECSVRTVQRWLKSWEQAGCLKRIQARSSNGAWESCDVQFLSEACGKNAPYDTGDAPSAICDAPSAICAISSKKKEKKEKEPKRKKIKNNNIINIYNNTANFQKDRASICAHGESEGATSNAVQVAAGFWGSYSPAASVGRYGALDYYPASCVRVSASVGGEGSAWNSKRAPLKLLAGGAENISTDNVALAPWFQQTRELIRHNSALLEQNQKLIEQNNALVQNYASVVEKYAALVERMGASSKPDGAQESVAASKTATVTTAKEEEGIKPASPWKKNTMQAQQQGSARAVKADPIKPIVDEAEIDPPKEKQDLTAYLAEVKTRQAQFVRRAQKMDILRSTRLKRSPYYFVGNNKLTEPEKKELSKQVAALAAFLQKRQTTEDLQKAVEILFSNRAVPKGYNKKAYYLALEEYCPAILYDMVRNLLKGKILLSNTTFLPNCADLSKHCRNKQALMHHLITNAEHLLKACEFSHPDEVPSEYW